MLKDNIIFLNQKDLVKNEINKILMNFDELYPCLLFYN